MVRLAELVIYWRRRLAEDFAALKEVRERNLEIARGVDRGNESRFADWIQGWQMSEAVSAPGMYHFCRLSGCRAISVPTRPNFSPSGRRVFVGVWVGVDGRCGARCMPNFDDDRRFIISWLC